MRTTGSLALLGSIALAAGCHCGGGDAPAAAIDVGAPLGQGIVTGVAGALAEAVDVSEGKGQLLLDVFHGDRAVNRKVKVTIAHDESRETPAGKGEGNQAFELDPGLYFVTIVYSESELVKDLEGTIAGLKVNAGHTSTYTVHLEAPVGLLHMRCSRTDGVGRPEVNIDAQVTLSVFPAGGDRSTPLWQGLAGDSIPLPTGTYDVKATFDGADGPMTEWYQSLVIAAAMGKTIPRCLFDLDTTGVQIDAFNFSSDVDDRSMVYFFNPGANVQQATARASGKAGEQIPVEPGEYDVLVVFQPSVDNLDLQGSRLLSGFVVPDRGGVRRQLDMELELGVVEVKVTDGAEDVSERVEIVVKRAGADPVAGMSLLESVGVGQHWLEAGTFDIYLTYEKADGTKKSESFRGVELPNGARWAQTFDSQEAAWIAQEVRRPAAPLHAIDWRDPALQDDDSADDDDSAGNAATPAPTLAPTPAP